MRKKKISLVLISFLQAIALAAYCSLVGTIFWRGGNIFGKDPSFWGPFTVLILLVVSVLISGLITLGYPAILFFKRKRIIEALKLVGYTAAWLVGIVLLTITIGLLAF